jgi:hypothetical protein
MNIRRPNRREGYLMQIKVGMAVVVSFCLTVFSETGLLKGVVKDGTTRSPLANAIVKLSPKGLVDTTDTKGNFQFSFAVSVLQKGPSGVSLTQPRYVRGKGIVFVNTTKGIVRADIFDLSGKAVATLNNSVLDQGIWFAPVSGLAAAMYLCRIKTTIEMNTFRFIISETGHQSGIRHKIEAVNSSKDHYLSKAASATIIDTVITCKPGYYCDTLPWPEIVADSVTIALLDTALVRPVSSVRTTMPFDTGWLFNKGDASGADKAPFADASWRALSVPHDWSIEGPYSSSATTAAGGGFLPAGIGWYRKHFTLPAAFSERRIFIEFDGVMCNSTVYINGVSLGNRPYGYMTFRYEMTSQVTTGLTENVIAIKVDNTAQPASRWYTGSGINRHVRIIATNPVHIDKWATVVTTPTTSGVHVATTIVNQGSIAQSVAVQAAVFDPSNTALTPVT